MTGASNHPRTGASSHPGMPRAPLNAPYGRESYAQPRRLPRTYTRDASLSDPRLAELDVYDPLFDGNGDLYQGFPHEWMKDGQSTRLSPGYRVDRSKITLPKV